LAAAGCGSGDGASGLPSGTPGSEAVDVVAYCEAWEEIENLDLVYQNNVWGKGDITDYEQCLLRRDSEGHAQYGWRWQWPVGAGNVKAYPEVIYGHKPWHASSTTTALPVRIASVNELSVHYNVELNAQGTYNLAFDIWVTGNNPPTPETITHEIMIWMNRTFEPQSREFLVGQVAIDDMTYDLYIRYIRSGFDPEPGADHGFSEEKFQYIAFVSHEDQFSGAVQVEKFLAYLVDHDYMSADEYVVSVELGNEVIEGTGELWLESYQVKVD
jgi:hypothetical protein